MKIAFREFHLFALLEEWSKQQLPLDLFISNYFRAHKALGSKDRAFLAETIYAMVRWQALLDHLIGSPYTWQRRFQAYTSTDLEKLKEDSSIPAHIRLSCPESLYNLIVKSHGLQIANQIALDSNKPAPTTVRANILKTTRDALIQRWKDTFPVTPCKYSTTGITFAKKTNFFTLPEFKEGLFEVQDEGSQLLAALVKVQPNQLVLDYCAGSGGKTLAFAPQMQNKGQIYLHDIRPWALQEAKKRLKRAGIQNYQILLPDSPHSKKLKKKMDWVLADVPCSGTGTLRRNPDMKWRFTEEMVERLVGQQRTIFEKALSFLSLNGRIVYATCSLLNEENQEQIDHFLKTYPLELEGNIFQSLPSEGNMDGFFGAVFKMKKL